MTDVERMLEEVAAEVGLDDYGDPTFREGLEVLARSADTQAALNPIGQAGFERQCRQLLTNRLRVLGWHRHHPDLREQPVTAPIVLCGLSRSGTTALSHLLAADPANRSLLAWEAVDSVPPPTTETYRTDSRFLAARDAPNALDQLNPGFKAIHHDPPDMPVECLMILAQHFVSAHFSTMFNLPDYDEWFLQTDWTPAYEYHVLELQVLQSECPGRWQLKTPGHAIGIDAVLAVYPDARFVVTHRDPVKATASVVSLVNSLSGTFSDADHRAYIAGHWPVLVGAMLDRVMDARDRVGDEQFYDLPYQDLVADPVGAVEAMYGYFGIDVTDDTDAALRHHAATHEQHKYGRHDYSLAEFGLERAALEERYARYLERFDVPREDV